MTMLIAGHETTAAVLTWTLYLLALHPEAAEAIRREVGGQGQGAGGLCVCSGVSNRKRTKPK